MGMNWLAEIKSAILKKKNDDMPGKSVMLQIEATEGDVENVELFHSPGVLSIPATGGQIITVDQKRGRIAIAHHDYRVDIAVSEGETAIYSTDPSGTVKTQIILKSDGTMEIGGNSKNFVTHAELAQAISGLITSLNGQLASVAAGATAAVAASGLWMSPLTLGGLSCDISAAKTTNIKTGG